ncbi:Cytochrome c oxidase subunit IIa family protein [Planococcus glaciei]|uniref:cytochrome c oxidase subunit 2A n=1 Tax=Planococcus glaciei TaxID=459472 RepID=UPI0008871E56|nr:cytochrome c oxidase subunit 2A [Planococcus glaciei]SDH48597.1 Cytochrome c oxidase subunit IIa family protein [Planococcus glaciei]
MRNASPEEKKEKKPVSLPETSLAGTFVSVLILAAFMLIAWSGVFLLFLSRN